MSTFEHFGAHADPGSRYNRISFVFKGKEGNPSKNDEKSTFPNSFQSDQGQPLRLPGPLRDPYPSARARHTPLVLPSLPRCPALPRCLRSAPSVGREASIERSESPRMDFFNSVFFSSCAHPGYSTLSSCALSLRPKHSLIASNFPMGVARSPNK